MNTILRGARIIGYIDSVWYFSLLKYRGNPTKTENRLCQIVILSQSPVTNAASSELANLIRYMRSGVLLFLNRPHFFRIVVISRVISNFTSDMALVGPL